MIRQWRASWRLVAATPRFDFFVVALLILLAEFEIWSPPGCIAGSYPFTICNFGESLGPRPVEIVYTTVASLLLLQRRRLPVELLLAVATLSIVKAVVWVGSPDLGYFLPLLVASYSVGRYHKGRRPWLVLLAAALVVLATNAIHDLRVPGQAPSGTLATFYLVALGALPMGRALQTRDLRAELSEARARQADRERGQAAIRAVAEERGRIARELHDVVAHGLSLVIVQSVAAQGVARTDPARAVVALEAIEQTARQGLDEMRRLLAVLDPRQTGQPLEPAPGLESVEPLVSKAQAAGQPVELTMSGDAEQLSPGLERLLYRLVQEALTNAVKHASGAATHIALRLGSDAVDLEVVSGAGRDTSPSDGVGRGLIGMRERVAIYGGAFEAGPNEAGGFRVHATIPISAAS